MKIGSAARFQIEPRVNGVDLCKQARNDVLKRCRAGGFLRMNFRDTEFTLSGGFTGNYLLDDPSSYVALGVYREIDPPARPSTRSLAARHSPRSGS
jgi:hypothetical protein